jgi:kinetochore protein NNF1
VWRQLNAKLEESAKAEFEEIVAERQAVQHLNELDRLVGDARARRETEGDGQGSGDAYVFLLIIFRVCWIRD